MMDTPTYKAPDGAWYDSPADYFFTGVLGGCGCGTSDQIAEEALTVFKYFARDREEVDWIDGFWDNPVREVLAHWIDSKELIEHGSSVYGSWLTPEGQEVWDSIKEDV